MAMFQISFNGHITLRFSTLEVALKYVVRNGSKDLIMLCGI